MIAVCIASRGLMHSRTVDDVINNLDGYSAQFFWSHSKPLPQAHNDMTDEALASNASHLWYVDDDMKLPRGVLDELMRAGCDIALADYPVDVDKHAVQHWEGTRYGDITLGGFGCVLVKRSVFDKLTRPYFRTDTRYVLPDLTPKPVTQTNVHGMHDVDFFVRAHQINARIAVISMRAGQYEVVRFSDKHGNNTNYDIKEWSFA